MQLLSRVLQAVLEVALPILVSAAATWMVGKAREVFKKMKDEKPETYYILSEIVSKSVTAAEQIYKGHGLGEKKKKYVLDLIENYLKDRGLDIDVNIIDAYIESEVSRMNLSLYDKYPSENEAPNVNVQTTVQE